MKVIIVFIFCFQTSISRGQNEIQLTNQELRLSDIIKASFRIESHCLGLNCMDTSILFSRADSLFKKLSLPKALYFYKDSSHNLKYYSFKRLLILNDSIAFKILKQTICDSTNISFAFDDETGTQKFNELLVYEYEMFIHYKYYNQKRPQKWILKQRQLCDLLKKTLIKTQYFCV